MANLTIDKAISIYGELLSERYGDNTARTYSKAITLFRSSLLNHGIDVKTPAARMNEHWIIFFINDIDRLSYSTKTVYMYSIIGLLKFLKTEKIADINLDLVKQLSKSALGKPFKADSKEARIRELARLVEYATHPPEENWSDSNEQLRMLRDSAIVLVLADIEMEVDTLPELKTGNVNFADKTLTYATKGSDRVVITPISPRLFRALRIYLDIRSQKLSSDEPFEKLPLLARHDKGAGRKIKKITPTTIRNVITDYVKKVISPELSEVISPNSFKDYRSAISVLLSSFDLLHPIICERCKEHFILGNYDESISNAMKAVEVETRNISTKDPNDFGNRLFNKALNPDSPLVVLGITKSERTYAQELFSGLVGYFKNPRSHRFIDIIDPLETFECLTSASLLLRLLDKSRLP